MSDHAFPIYRVTGEIVLEADPATSVADVRTALAETVRAPRTLVSLLDEDVQAIMDDGETLGWREVLRGGEDPSSEVAGENVRLLFSTPSSASGAERKRTRNQAELVKSIRGQVTVVIRNPLSPDQMASLAAVSVDDHVDKVAAWWVEQFDGAKAPPDVFPTLLADPDPFPVSAPRMGVDDARYEVLDGYAYKMLCPVPDLYGVHVVHKKNLEWYAIRLLGHPNESGHLPPQIGLPKCHSKCLSTYPRKCPPSPRLYDSDSGLSKCHSKCPSFCLFKCPTDIDHQPPGHIGPPIHIGRRVSQEFFFV